jgi:hypothetical protein
MTAAVPPSPPFSLPPSHGPAVPTLPSSDAAIVGEERADLEQVVLDLHLQALHHRAGLCSEGGRKGGGEGGVVSERQNESAAMAMV